MSPAQKKTWRTNWPEKYQLNLDKTIQEMLQREQPPRVILAIGLSAWILGEELVIENEYDGLDDPYEWNIFGVDKKWYLDGAIDQVVRQCIIESFDDFIESMKNHKNKIVDAMLLNSSAFIMHFSESMDQSLNPKRVEKGIVEIRDHYVVKNKYIPIATLDAVFHQLIDDRYYIVVPPQWKFDEDDCDTLSHIMHWAPKSEDKAFTIEELQDWFTYDFVMKDAQTLVNKLVEKGYAIKIKGYFALKASS
jgi:hypothetical protein